MRFFTQEAALGNVRLSVGLSVPPGPIRAGGKLIETASMKEIFPIAHVAEVPVFGQRSEVQGQADPLNFRIGDHCYCYTGSELNDTMFIH